MSLGEGISLDNIHDADNAVGDSIVAIEAARTKESTQLSINASTLTKGTEPNSLIQKAAQKLGSKPQQKGEEEYITHEIGGYYIRSTELNKFLYINGDTIKFGEGPDKDSGDGAKKEDYIWIIDFKEDGTSFIYSTVDKDNNIYWRNKHGIFTLKKKNKKDSLLLNKRISLTSDDKRIDRKFSWNIFVTYKNQIRIRSTQNNKFIRVDEYDNITLSRYKRGRDERGRDEMLFDIIPVESYTGNGDISSLTNNHKKFLMDLEDDYAESNTHIKKPF